MGSMYFRFRGGGWPFLGKDFFMQSGRYIASFSRINVSKRNAGGTPEQSNLLQKNVSPSITMK